MTSDTQPAPANSALKMAVVERRVLALTTQLPELLERIRRLEQQVEELSTTTDEASET